MIRCAVCNAACSDQSSRPYQIGTVRGRLCVSCESSLGVALAGWMHRRLKEVAAASERASEERDQAKLLALEVLPLSTRRAMSRRSA